MHYCTAQLLVIDSQQQGLENKPCHISCLTQLLQILNFCNMKQLEVLQLPLLPKWKAAGQLEVITCILVAGYPTVLLTPID